MKIDKAIELMKVERECVMRNDDVHCDRDCANCDLRDLLEKTSDIIEAYDTVIETLEVAESFNKKGSWKNNLVLLLAYIPTGIFTTAICHLLDNGNLIWAIVFTIILVMTLPVYKYKG